MALITIVPPGSCSQFGAGDHRRDHRRVDHGPGLVDDEAAVGVPVEDQRQISPVRGDRPLCVDEVLRLQRIRRVVGEVAVELGVELDQVQVQRAEDRRQGVPGHPVPGVDDQLQPPASGEVDEAVQVGGVRGQQILLGQRSGGLDRGGRRPGQRQSGNLAQLLRRDRGGVAEAELHAIVAAWVVTGGEHGARPMEMPGREPQLVGTGQPDIDHVDAAIAYAVDERPAQLRPRQPHVPADDQGVGTRGETERGHGRGPDRVRSRGVPLDVGATHGWGWRHPGCRWP